MTFSQNFFIFDFKLRYFLSNKTKFLLELIASLASDESLIIKKIKNKEKVEPYQKSPFQ